MNMSEERCVCCGKVVPEGRMVCPDCEKKAEEGKSNGQGNTK